jgi:hypothetical protein
LPTRYGRESQDHRFQGGTIYNDAASGLIWVENQVSLGANETVMGKAHFEQWLWDKCVSEVKHYHGDNGFISAEEYHRDCEEKGQSQSFSGVGAQHQNACKTSIRLFWVAYRCVLGISLTIELVHKIMRGALAHLVTMCA